MSFIVLIIASILSKLSLGILPTPKYSETSLPFQINHSWDWPLRYLVGKVPNGEYETEMSINVVAATPQADLVIAIGTEAVQSTYLVFAISYDGSMAACDTPLGQLIYTPKEHHNLITNLGNLHRINALGHGIQSNFRTTLAQGDCAQEWGVGVQNGNDMATNISPLTITINVDRSRHYQTMITITKGQDSFTGQWLDTFPINEKLYLWFGVDTLDESEQFVLNEIVQAGTLEHSFDDLIVSNKYNLALPKIDDSYWVQASSRGKILHNSDISNELFKYIFECPSEIINNYGILVRLCPKCNDEYKKIYYKRKTIIPIEMEFKRYFTSYWRSQDNVLTYDFDLFSNINDLINNENAWVSCDYNEIGIGFPYNCGKSHNGYNQWNSFGDTYQYTGNNIGQYDAGFYILMNKNCLLDKLNIIEDNIRSDYDSQIITYPNDIKVLQSGIEGHIDEVIIKKDIKVINYINGIIFNKPTSMTRTTNLLLVKLIIKFNYVIVGGNDLGEGFPKIEIGLLNRKNNKRQWIHKTNELMNGNSPNSLKIISEYVSLSKKKTYNLIFKFINTNGNKIDIFLNTLDIQIQPIVSKYYGIKF